MKTLLNSKLNKTASISAHQNQPQVNDRTSHKLVIPKSSLAENKKKPRRKQTWF